MKARHDRAQIANLLDRRKSTISLELIRNTDSRGYRHKQACELLVDRAKNSRNAPAVEPWVRKEAFSLLQLQWSPEQTAARSPVSHGALYQHVYAENTEGGALWQNLRCQKQKMKRCAGGRDPRGQIPNSRPLSDGPLHIEARRQIGHWECDTLIGGGHKSTNVTMVERKSGCAILAKVPNKTSELASSTVLGKFKPFSVRIKTLNYDNGKEFAGHNLINNLSKKYPISV